MASSAAASCLFGGILLLLNFLDGLYKLAKLNWHIAYQIVMTILIRRPFGAADSAHPRLSRRVSSRSSIGAACRPRDAYSRGELRQHILAGRRKLCGIGREALYDAAAAAHAAANRADVGAAGRAQHEQFFTRPHRPQHDHGRRRRRAAVPRRRCRSALPREAAAPPPLAAETAFSQPAESFALFFSRHCSAGAPPVGTPAQTFG
jgi:hypothetical protein